jgi:Dolichyl-phosphate-mannose-protein mannosyltransferase
VNAVHGLLPLSHARPRVRSLIALAVVIGIVWRCVRYGLGFPVWGDEAFVAISLMTRGYASMIPPLEYGQIVPVGFMWVELAARQALGTSEWALRLVPFLAGVAALLLFVRFARSATTPRAALLAICILALAYYPIRHAAEIKPYATDLLISLGLSMLAWRVLRSERDARAWAGLIVLSGVCAWLSYPSIFVCAGIGAALCVRLTQRRSAAMLAGLAAFTVASLGGFASMYLTYGRAHAEFAARLVEIDMWSATFPPAHPLKFVYWFFAMHTGNMLAYPAGGQAPASVATFLLVILGGLRLWRRDRVLLTLLLAPLAATFAAAALQKYPYGGSARTSLYMAPAFCLLAGIGAEWLIARLTQQRKQLVGHPRLPIDVGRRAVTRFLAIGMCLAIASVGIARDVVSPFKNPPVYVSHRAILEQSRAARPGERWIIFNATTPAAHAPYLGDWRGVGGQFVFDALRYGPPGMLWSPPPEFLAAEARRPLTLLAYRYTGKKATFPESQYAAYVAELERIAGPGDVSTVLVKKDEDQHEEIEVRRY